MEEKTKPKNGSTEVEPFLGSEKEWSLYPTTIQETLHK